MSIKDTAICIRTVDYSETSQIVTFFAREKGKFSAIAKGAKRPKSPFNGTIEPFSYGPVVFIQKPKLAVLTEFKQKPIFKNTIKDLFILNCSLFASELLNNFTDDYDSHPELYDSFLQFLNDLQQPTDSKNAALLMLIFFQLSLLKEVGLQPVLNSCTNCKSNYSRQSSNWSQVYFSSSANSLICRDCELNFADKFKLSPEAAACLADLKLFADAEEKTFKEIERLLVHHFTELLHKPPMMAKYLSLS